MAQTTDLAHTDPLMRAVAKVRSKVGAPHVIFEDDEYLSDLEDVGGIVLRAAALRLLAIANSEAYIQKVQETLELKTDGSKLSDTYRATAKLYLSMEEAAIPVPVVEAPKAKTYFPRRVDGYSLPNYACDRD